MKSCEQEKSHEKQQLCVAGEESGEGVGKAGKKVARRNEKKKLFYSPFTMRRELIECELNKYSYHTFSKENEQAHETSFAELLDAPEQLLTM